MKNGRYSNFKGMTWPLPELTNGDELSVEWKLRYDPRLLTRDDYYYLASVLHAYSQMIRDPIKKRQVVISNLRKDLYPSFER